MNLKFFLAIFDLIDVKLKTNFYPKRKAELSYKNSSDCLGTHILFTKFSLEHYEIFLPIVDITDTKFYSNSVLKKRSVSFRKLKYISSTYFNESK